MSKPDEKEGGARRLGFLAGTVLERAHKAYTETNGANRYDFKGAITRTEKRIAEVDAETLHVLITLYEHLFAACYDAKLDATSLSADQGDMLLCLQMAILDTKLSSQLPALDPLSSRETRGEPFVVTHKELAVVANQLKERIRILTNELADPDRSARAKHSFVQLCRNMCMARCIISMFPKNTTADARMLRRTLTEGEAERVLALFTVPQETLARFDVTQPDLAAIHLFH